MLENRTEITVEFLEKNNFKNIHKNEYRLLMPGENETHILSALINERVIRYAKKEDRVNEPYRFKTITQKDFTEERLNSIYLAFTGQVLKPISKSVLCTIDTLKELGFRETAHEYVITLPNETEECDRCLLVVNLTDGYIHLHLALQPFGKRVVLEESNISVQRIKEIYLGLTGKGLTSK